MLHLTVKSLLINRYCIVACTCRSRLDLETLVNIYLDIILVIVRYSLTEQFLSHVCSHRL
jgi:hypothetical protein